jgi:hypothetical protein
MSSKFTILSSMPFTALGITFAGSSVASGVSLSGDASLPAFFAGASAVAVLDTVTSPLLCLHFVLVRWLSGGQVLPGSAAVHAHEGVRPPPVVEQELGFSFLWVQRRTMRPSGNV